MSIIDELQSGQRRAANKTLTGSWKVDTEVKGAILNIFKTSLNVDYPGGFVDKEALKPREFTEKDDVRMVPYGSTVRPGTYIGKHVVIMPPSYINVGAYVDDNTMVDSHVLVGSCAQVGKNVHLSAGVQVGGVLEPIGERPCIIEDNVFVGAGTILTEGVLVRKNAVIAAGVTLTKSIPIFDHIYDTKYYGEVPENAVVVPGSRTLKTGVNIACCVIVKYRDFGTDKAVALEEALR
ncbi:MAG: 2,3,4,5-tetrahydropyridine-2,6-dicarboxylate N-succinyltransferase [Alphaproteobacteria bacterium]|nr:MAG: 2,3,4,5-tetrahydropyridine-2,6-dicarboxylate N-succinyltransferase [Alphaproteobacteria bacterium]